MDSVCKARKVIRRVAPSSASNPAPAKFRELFEIKKKQGLKAHTSITCARRSNQSICKVVCCQSPCLRIMMQQLERWVALLTLIKLKISKFSERPLEMNMNERSQICDRHTPGQACHRWFPTPFCNLETRRNLKMKAAASMLA